MKMFIKEGIFKGLFSGSYKNGFWEKIGDEKQD